MPDGPAEGTEADLGHEALSSDAASDVGTLARGGALQVAGQFSQKGFAFIFNAVAAHLLSSGGFGVYQIVLRIYSIAAQVGLFGFNYATMRFMAQGRAQNNPSQVRGAARLGVLCTTGLSLIVFAAVMIWARPLSNFFTKGGNPAEIGAIARYLRIGAAYIPLFALMQIFRYVTQSYKTMVPSVITGNIVQPAARLVIGIALLAAGMQVAGATASLGASAAVGAAVGLWYYLRIFTAEERAAAPRFSLRKMLAFSIPQAGSSLLGVQTLGLSVLILGHYSTHAQAGLFAIALALQAPGNIFLGGIVNIWAPVVSDLYDRGAIDRLESLYQTINRWVATFSFPVFAMLIVMPEPLAQIFAGSKGLQATSIVIVLAAGNAFYTGTGPTGYVLSMTGRPGINFINSAVAVVLYIVAGAWVAPAHGAFGVALVDALITAAINSARVIETRILVGVQPYGRSFFKPLVASVAAGGFLLAYKSLFGSAIVVGLAGIALSGVVFLAALKLLGLDVQERYVWDRIRRRAFTRKGRR
jgi:O-antigen/teichoic acid export membrane protein